MKRRIVVTDRLGCAIAGTALVAAGGFVATFGHGDVLVPSSGAVTMPWLPGAVSSAWWPFALGAVGVVLIALGLSWLFSHRPRQTPRSASLPGSGADGQLTVDLGAAASAAADALALQPHIAAASGAALIDRGQRVIELDVKIEPSSGGLVAAMDATNAARADLVAALDGVPVATRILVRTTRTRTGAARVR